MIEYPRQTEHYFTFAFISKLRLVRCLTVAEHYFTRISSSRIFRRARLKIRQIKMACFPLNSNYRGKRTGLAKEESDRRSNRQCQEYIDMDADFHGAPPVPACMCLRVHKSVHSHARATDVCLLVNICISTVNTTSYAVHDFRLTSCLLHL